MRLDLRELINVSVCHHLGYHGVKIQDNALIAAATLSDRYISDRFLPDKAIDLVDEACALIKTEMNSMPSEMEDVSRRIMQLEIEVTSLKKEKDENKRREKENNEIKNNLYAVTEAEKIVNEVRKENAKKLEEIKNSPANLDSFNAINECLSK